MSDLREALERRDRQPPADLHDSRTIVAAARRWLALTETGPDYEAARKFSRIDEGNDWPMGVLMEPEAFIQGVVDAALADYLTEEET